MCVCIKDWISETSVSLCVGGIREENEEKKYCVYDYIRGLNRTDGRC